MGQEGVNLGTVTVYTEQRVLRVTLDPNSTPLKTGINRFQILAFTFNLLVFIDICIVQCKYVSAENYGNRPRIPNIKFSTRRDLVII